MASSPEHFPANVRFPGESRHTAIAMWRYGSASAGTASSFSTIQHPSHPGTVGHCHMSRMRMSMRSTSRAEAVCDCSYRAFRRGHLLGSCTQAGIMRSQRRSAIRSMPQGRRQGREALHSRIMASASSPPFADHQRQVTIFDRAGAMVRLASTSMVSLSIRQRATGSSRRDVMNGIDSDRRRD